MLRLTGVFFTVTFLSVFLPLFSTMIVQSPAFNDGKEKLPSEDVVVVCLSSKRIAVTVAFGTACPLTDVQRPVTFAWANSDELQITNKKVYKSFIACFICSGSQCK